MTEIEPNFASGWFDLGMAQEQAEDYAAAIKSFSKYLDLSPNANDRQAVQDKIYELEYKRDKVAKKRAAPPEQKRDEATSLSGTYRESCGMAGNYCYYRINIGNGEIDISMRNEGGGWTRMWWGRVNGSQIENGIHRTNTNCSPRNLPMRGRLDLNRQEIHITYDSYDLLGALRNNCVTHSGSRSWRANDKQ